MNFQDIGIIIAQKPLKENSTIISVLSMNNGLYSGVARWSSKKSKFLLQPGNLVDFFWQARLHEHIGSARCDLIKSYTGVILQNKSKLYAFNSIVSLVLKVFGEREPHNNFFSLFKKYLDGLAKDFNFRSYIEVELGILAESGYALQLDKCGATGEISDLFYVSPKTGRAISRNEGKKHSDKLLLLPEFFTNQNAEPSRLEIIQAFNLTSYFFNRYLFHGQSLSTREAFIDHVKSSSNDC